MIARGPNATWRRALPGAVRELLDDDTAGRRASYGGYHFGRVLLGTDDVAVKVPGKQLRSEAGHLDGALDSFDPELCLLVTVVSGEWAESQHPSRGDSAVGHFDRFEWALGLSLLEAELAARR